jgi:hypothetical protein
MKAELVRKTWPKIRVVYVKGEKFYQVGSKEEMGRQCKLAEVGRTSQ